MFKSIKFTMAAATLSLAASLGHAAAETGHEHGGHGDHQMMAKETVETTAVIHSVDIEARKINASHAPIPAISWPKMTMDFAVMKHVDLSSVEVDTTVVLVLARGEDGIYAIHGIKAHDEEHKH